MWGVKPSVVPVVILALKAVTTRLGVAPMNPTYKISVQKGTIIRTVKIMCMTFRL